MSDDTQAMSVYRDGEILLTVLIDPLNEVDDDTLYQLTMEQTGEVISIVDGIEEAKDCAEHYLDGYIRGYEEGNSDGDTPPRIRHQYGGRNPSTPGQRGDRDDGPRSGQSLRPHRRDGFGGRSSGGLRHLPEYGQGTF